MGTPPVGNISSSLLHYLTEGRGLVLRLGLGEVVNPEEGFLSPPLRMTDFKKDLNFR
jgi:hypothetical protein